MHGGFSDINIAKEQSSSIKANCLKDKKRVYTFNFYLDETNENINVQNKRTRKGLVKFIR